MKAAVCHWVWAAGEERLERRSDPVQHRGWVRGIAEDGSLLGHHGSPVSANVVDGLRQCVDVGAGSEPRAGADELTVSGDVGRDDGRAAERRFGHRDREALDERRYKGQIGRLIEPRELVVADVPSKLESVLGQSESAREIDERRRLLRRERSGDDCSERIGAILRPARNAAGLNRRRALCGDGCARAATAAGDVLPRVAAGGDEHVGPVHRRERRADPIERVRDPRYGDGRGQAPRIRQACRLGRGEIASRRS